MFLNGRAGHRSIGAKDAAVARLRLEPGAAALAVMEEPAGVGRHSLDRLIAALGTGQSRLQLHEPSRKKDAGGGKTQKGVGPAKNKNGGGGGGDDGLTELGLDALLIALLKKIPTSGDWPAQQRLRWFRTFAMNVSQIYDEGR